MSRRLIESHRSSIADLVALMYQEFVELFGLVSSESPKQQRRLVESALPEIVTPKAAAAGSLAVAYYSQMRVAAGAPGEFDPVVSGLPNMDRLTSLARWSTVPLEREVPDGLVFVPEPDPDAALSRLAGGAQRVVATTSRTTIFDSVARDPADARWVRDARPDCCAFCALLATRGVLDDGYTSREAALEVSGANLGGKDYRKARRLDGTVTAERRAEILAGSRAKTIAQGGRKGRDTKQPMGEKFHDYCRCEAVPIWDGDYDAPEHVQGWVDAYSDLKADTGDTKAVLAELRNKLGTH